MTIFSLYLNLKYDIVSQVMLLHHILNVLTLFKTEVREVKHMLISCFLLSTSLLRLKNVIRTLIIYFICGHTE